MIKGLKGKVQHQIFFFDHIEKTFIILQTGMKERGEGFIPQMFLSQFGKLHEIFEVMVASTRNEVIPFVELEPRNKIIQKVFSNGLIVDKTHGLTFFAVTHRFVYLFQEAFSEVIVNVQFCITGQFDGIGFKMIKMKLGKQGFQSKTNNIIQKNDVFTAAYGKKQKAPQTFGRDFNDGILHINAWIFACHFYREVNGFILQTRKLLHIMEHDRG